MSVQEVQDELDKLALAVSRSAQTCKDLPEQVKALQALTGYLAMVKKGRKGASDDDSEGMNFDQIRAAALEPDSPEPEEGPNGRAPRISTGRRGRVHELRAGQPSQ